MTTAEKLIKNKLGLLQLAAYLKSVSFLLGVLADSQPGNLIVHFFSIPKYA